MYFLLDLVCENNGSQMSLGGGRMDILRDRINYQLLSTAHTKNEASTHKEGHRASQQYYTAAVLSNPLLIK